ncbi:WD40 repeat-like protein [Rhizopogon vinicolor AM-OR11-026]|uniref:WD40 repeat-like protein n=1 Tax=Rhizopogon vinicolor AM-OR11-026 TaxID=1314800 RepID=A0A1B7N7D6_9AGAM|nr:WD40 repeat-like protein [Rhizopogon vinicolor AM-OR11-026]
MVSHTLGLDVSPEVPKLPTEKKQHQTQMILAGHEEWVTGVAVIPGTCLLVTCSQDKSLRLWDLNKGQQVGEPLLGHGSPVWAVAASPDGRWIGHWRSPISDIVFAPDSETFASASYDHTVRVWLRETGETVQVLELDPPPPSTLLYSVSYSPDGSKLVAGYIMHMQQLVVWNAASGEDILKIRSCCRAAFTADGLRLVSADGSGIRISDASTGVLINQLDTHNSDTPILPAIAPSDTKFATTLQEESIQFFDLNTLKPIGGPLEHPMGVSCMAISQDGQLIATGCRDNLVRIWSVPETKSEKKSRKHANKVPFLLTYTAHTLTISDLQDTRHAGPSLLTQTIPRRPFRAALSRGFFDGVGSTYPPHHPNQTAYGGSQRLAPHSRLKNLVNRLPFRSQSQQAQPEDAHLRRSNRANSFLRQYLFHRSRTNNEPLVVDVEVAAGRKFTRLAAVDVPEYRKVNDTRRPPTASQNTTENDPFDSSDNDSLPDVHWCMAFLCYCSCWSRGTLRMPPRWRLERVDQV